MEVAIAAEAATAAADVSIEVAVDGTAEVVSSRNNISIDNNNNSLFRCSNSGSNNS